MTILHILDQQGPKTFVELENLADLFPATLHAVLLELEKEGKIEKAAHGGKLAYQITVKGKGTILEFGILGVLATQVMQQRGIYQDDYSNWRGSMYYYQLPWGIQDDIIIAKSLEELNPITKDAASQVHKLLYQCIKEDVKNRKVQLDDTKDGEIILGFIINYKDLVESINKQSLLYLDNMSDRERDLLAKWEEGTVTKADKEEFEELRKRTKVKGGVQLR